MISCSIHSSIGSRSSGTPSKICSGNSRCSSWKHSNSYCLKSSSASANSFWASNCRSSEFFHELYDSESDYSNFRGYPGTSSMSSPDSGYHFRPSSYIILWRCLSLASKSNSEEGSFYTYFSLLTFYIAVCNSRCEGAKSSGGNSLVVNFSYFSF